MAITLLPVNIPSFLLLWRHGLMMTGRSYRKWRRREAHSMHVEDKYGMPFIHTQKKNCQELTNRRQYSLSFPCLNNTMRLGLFERVALSHWLSDCHVLGKQRREAGVALRIKVQHGVMCGKKCVSQIRSGTTSQCLQMCATQPTPMKPHTTTSYTTTALD